ncbi:unnamed protein product [Polarella glacialis]|uniref:Uncharacterized protein n=1 Tax=Polarella glacialis TaxID=89957 RepID=A0A813K775_POLGL|nr:unnamed protein product [Polarella glacialis]
MIASVLPSLPSPPEGLSKSDVSVTFTVSAQTLWHHIFIARLCADSLRCVHSSIPHLSRSITPPRPLPPPTIITPTIMHTLKLVMQGKLGKLRDLHGPLLLFAGSTPE